MSPELINNIATAAGIVVAVLGAFLFAFWVAMGIWAFNDIRSRTHDWLSILLAVLLVMAFPIIGLVLYTMIRPKQTLAEVYDRALEEEALLRELEVTLACPTCGVPVKENWVYCAACHNQLQHSCPNCSKLVRNEWDICVYCGTNQPSAAASPFTRTATTTVPSTPGQAEPVPVQAARRRPTRPSPFTRDRVSPLSETDENSTFRPAQAE